jgi:RNA polymerase sigma factor (sigma-70 family)
MTMERIRSALPCVGALFDVGTMGSLTDAELLDRFTARGGEASELAFAALVERHGPMVLRVCRRALGDRDAALDAFQATFLVLATKCGTLRRRESLGSWLYGVAQRVARVARSAAARRQSHERRKAEEATVIEGPRPFEDRAAVREEFECLPERYRAAIALCDLDDLTHEEAAGRLGWPVGTVKSRLARGRARLRERLARRGLAPTAVAPLLSPRIEPIPPSLVNDLSRMASKIAAGAPMAGVVPASTSALVQGVHRMMLKDAMRNGIAGALVIGFVAAGLALAAQQPKPAPAPARPGPGAVEEVQICHEVRFCAMGRQGTAWREAFAATPGFRLVGSQPPATAWALDPATLRQFLEHCQSQAVANILQAPKVTSFDGIPALIFNVNTIDLERGGRPPRADEVKGGFRDTGWDVLGGPKAALPPELRDPKAGTIKDGVEVRVTGTKVDQAVRMNVAVDLAHVVAVHDAVMPGSATVPPGPGEPSAPRKVKLPEIERSRIAGEWTIGDGETLVLSLGLIRSVKQGGRTPFGPTLRGIIERADLRSLNQWIKEGGVDPRTRESLDEMLVVNTPRLNLMEGEDQHFVIPSLGGRQPQSAVRIDPAPGPGPR